MPTLKRLPRPLRWILLGASYLILGLIALVALVLVAVNVPIVNAAIARKVTSSLEPTFKGRLVLHRLGNIDFGGVLGAEVEVIDPSGNSVLTARDVDVRTFWPGLVWGILTEDSTTTSIGIDRVAVAHVRVGLIDDGSGTPTLAQAFEPRQPEPEPTESGGTIFTLDELRIRSVEVRGALASPGPIDADLTDLEASVESRPEALHLVLERLVINARQVPQIDRVSGQLTADVTLPAEAETPKPRSAEREPRASGERTTTATYALRPVPPPARRVTAAFAGELGDSIASAQVRMLGEKILAELEAPALTPATLGRLAPGLSPKAPAALVAKIEGALDDFGFDARVTQKAASVAARGRVRQADETSRIEAHVDVAGVDLAQLMAEGADTDLNLGADARLSFDRDGGKGDYSVVTKSSRFGGDRLPVARIRGDIALPSERPMLTTGTLNVDEPGAATEVTYRVEAAEAGTRANVSARTKLSRPPRLSELTGGLSVDGELTAQAEIDSASESVDASFNLDLTRVKHPQLTARRVRVDGRANGDIALPKLDVTAQLEGVSAAGRKFSAVRAAARGTPSRVMVSARADGSRPDRIVVTAAVSSGSELVIQHPQVTIIDPRGTIQLRAERVAFPEGKVQVDRLTLEGPGRAELTLRYGPSLERLVLETERLEPARLLEIMGVKSPLRGGELSVQAEVARGRGPPSGKLELELTNLEVGKLRRGRAHADLVLDRGKLSGTAEVELARGAKTSISVKDMRVPLAATEAEMRALTGEVSLDGEIDMKQLQGLVPLLGLERAEGTLRFDVALQRPPGEQSPTLRAHVKTKSLVIVQERPDAAQTQTAEQARSTSPLWVRGLDLELDAALETDRAEVQGRIFDRQGDVLRVSAQWKELGGAGNLSRLRQRLEAAPFTARVEVPPRAFDKFPAPIRPTEVAGIFSFGAEAEGTLRDPRVRVRGRVEKFGAAVERRGAPRLDMELAADYGQTGGSVRLRAHDRRRALLDLNSSWKGDAARLAAQTEGKSPITGDFGLALDEFPIEIVPALENRQIRGKVSGNVKLDQLGKDATLSADLTSRGLRVDRLRVGEVKASLQAKNGQLVVQTSMNGQAGRADAKIETGFTWKDRVIPELQQQITGTVHTEDLRLAALQPLMEGSVSELDGKLDSDIKAVVQDGAPRLSGQVRLKDGVLHVPSVGQQFHDMSALVKISPDAIVLEKLKARGTSGGFEADATAKLEGLTPIAAELNLRITEDNKLPLTVEGEAIGDGWGTVTAHYDHDETNKRNMVRVSLEKFNVELPQAPPKGIQDLSQPEHVRVGFHRRDREFVVIPLQPLEEPGAPSEYQTIVVVELGSVRVEKGQQAQVALGGEVRATLGDELNVEGKIEARRGELDISGKQFDIERATVTFTGGAPDDPTISAVARYDSPAGYTVYAEYTGTVERGKLSLRSEPPLSQDEILTLLLFGTPDGSIGAGSGGNDLATAVSVAGGTAAQGLNRALSDVTDLDVSARIDTSTGAPRPELVLQISSRVSARVTQALGEPTPGQSPDRTFVTIELRLASAWSLSTMVGDRGASAVDLIWRRRY